MARCFRTGHPVNGRPSGNRVFPPPERFGVLLSVFWLHANLRKFAGRDPVDPEERGDWAIITLDTDLSTAPDFQMMIMALPQNNTTVWDIGYASDRVGEALADYTGTLTIGSDGALYSNLDIIDGNSGSPWFHINPMNGNAEVVGVTAREGGFNPCAGMNGNVGASGTYFLYAPDNTAGVAAAKTSDGRLIVYASDKDWNFLGQRSALTIAQNSAYAPWTAFDNGFASGGRMAAVNLQDNRQQVWTITSTGVLKTRWLNPNGTWSAWTTQPNTTTVKDVAATGGNNVKTHLFILGTDNSVKVQWKTGDANSAWSAPWTIGTVANAKNLSAVYIPSAATHQMFISDGAGASTAWGSAGSFTGLQSFTANGTGIRAIGAGLLGDGRAKVVYAGSNGIYGRTRAANGSSWSNWTWMNVVLYSNETGISGFGSFTFGQQGGKAVLLAVTSEGEVVKSVEGSPDSFSSPWVRFYK